MELGMRLRCRQLPPNTNQRPPAPAPSVIGARAWACRNHRRRVWSLQVAAPDYRPLKTTAISASVTGGQGTKLRTDKFFQVEMTVRDCELDQYGVVNNAVYADYIEKAREVMADSLGISRDSIARTGKAMALSDLKLNYLAPLKGGAKFVVKVRIVEIKGARMLVEHYVETLPERKVVLEATATVVCLNEDYRPTRLLPEVASKLMRFFSS